MLVNRLVMIEGVQCDVRTEAHAKLFPRFNFSINAGIWLN